VQFLREFAVQAEAAGHRVVIEPTAEEEAEAPEATARETVARMLAAQVRCPAPSEEELGALKARLSSGEATEDDKWQHYVETYKTAWGLLRIDEGFLEKHGTRASCPEGARRPSCWRGCCAGIHKEA
jgi:hypothetical protein